MNGGIHQRTRTHRAQWSVILVLVLAIAGYQMKAYRSAEAWEPRAEIESLSSGYFGDPLPALTPALQREFENGFHLFIKVWAIHEGLGPRFNARSCAACHAVPMPGGSGTTAGTFVPQSETAHAMGGHALAQFTVNSQGAIVRLGAVPHLSTRKPPALFGLGLLEGVPIEVLQKLADPDDLDGDGVSGRLATLAGGVGRFGWKAAHPTVERFVAVALAVEIGLTNTGYRADEGSLSGMTSGHHAVEVSDEDVRALAQYIRLLTIPPRKTLGPLVSVGREVFHRLHCGRCHSETLRTGRSPVETLDQRTIHPFTDLLLHDMGPELADGIREGQATEREFRTPPLWGMGSTGPPYLHDGRAHSIEEAILTHGGEGRAARTRYLALTTQEQHALFEFLRSL